MKATINHFFADTYALIEIILGSKNYLQFRNCVLITTKFNLIELYYYLIKDYEEKIADKYLNICSDWVYPISNSTIKTGMKFKLKHKKENLSYIDCIGYALAIELGIKFLTGDKKFEDKFNVEFIK